MRYNHNKISVNPNALVLYVDMNSYFASCEQQLRPELRGKPIGVCPFEGERAVIIAPSKEAKLYGVKTGMRFAEAQLICPQIEMVIVRPVEYRKIHIAIMNVLRSYCDDVIPKSIDEAVVNLTNYRLVYKDPVQLATQIKQHLRQAVGEYITCSIGIAPNTFLAKLGTELQKPDGLVCINEENLATQLQRLQLTDMPGIAKRSEIRLNKLGIYTPLQMLQASESQLRKAFGGIVGTYWYYRLRFGEVDMHTSDYKAMSATRSIHKTTRQSKQALHSLLISLCTKLEHRLVKQGVFCREATFTTAYYNGYSWKAQIKFNESIQDGMELLSYLMHEVTVFEARSRFSVFNSNISSMGVIVSNFISDQHMQYSLFENRINKDIMRKAMYGIKDKYGKNSIRKASEMLQPGTMKDAIGFGSVKELYQNTENESALGNNFNQYLLEEDNCQ